MKHNITRNEEAVSAAIATVLLFGGVVSIIGLMLVSMLPIIEELEGSIERDDMSAQMMILAQQTEVLSEHGMPGDSTEVELIPLDGSLSWDSTRGGMWYSSTWFDDTTFRMKSILDFDDNIEIKHPESKTTAVCYSDLRLGPTRAFFYSVPDWVENLAISSAKGLAAPLGPIKIKLMVDGSLSENIAMNIDQSINFDTSTMTDLVLESSHELTILASSGQGGAVLVTPDNPSKNDGQGRSWTIPLSAGDSTIHVISDSSNLVTSTINGAESSEIVLESADFREGTNWTKTYTLQDSSVLTITTSAPSRLILLTDNTGTAGIVNLKSSSGGYLGTEFLTPQISGFLELTNPSDTIATATWKGGGISISPKSTESVMWPPSGTTGSPIVDIDTDVIVYWHNNNTNSDSIGASIIPASDTGFSSGLEHVFDTHNSNSLDSIITQIAGYESVWNFTSTISFNHSSNYESPFHEFSTDVGNHYLSVIEGHPMRVHRVSGNSGLFELSHDGAERCLGIDTTASGWISTDLPWNTVAGRSELQILDAWQDGSHPSSYSVDLIAEAGSSEYSLVASAWIFHISRLTYEFTSSVTGMEVAYSNGAVLTNHPEFLPTVLKQPNDRSGPGPRFASTIPALNPTSDSTVGSGNMNLDIELAYRESLASQTAYEVRRGWYSPYGEAIANSAASGLEQSIDWTIYPGRLDLLTDYVGWVPDPSIGTSEAVWHTNGEPIQFSLQLSSLDVTMTEAID